MASPKAFCDVTMPDGVVFFVVLLPEADNAGVVFVGLIALCCGG